MFRRDCGFHALYHVQRWGRINLVSRTYHRQLDGQDTIHSIIFSKKRDCLISASNDGISYTRSTSMALLTKSLSNENLLINIAKRSISHTDQILNLINLASNIRNINIVRQLLRCSSSHHRSTTRDNLHAIRKVLALPDGP